MLLKNDEVCWWVASPLEFVTILAKSLRTRNGDLLSNFRRWRVAIEIHLKLPRALLPCAWMFPTLDYHASKAAAPWSNFSCWIIYKPFSNYSRRFSPFPKSFKLQAKFKSPRNQTLCQVFGGIPNRWHSDDEDDDPQDIKRLGEKISAFDVVD